MRTLEDRLTQLGAQLDTDVADRLVTDVLHRLDAAPAPRQARSTASRRPVVRRRVLVPLVAAAAVLAVVLGVPDSRDAVADWFGIGTTRIERRAALPEGVAFPDDLDLGAPISAAEAEQLTGIPVPGSIRLGVPSGIVVVVPPPSGQVVVVYPPSSNLPASPVAGVGALLSVVDGDLDVDLHLKIAGSGTDVEGLEVQVASGERVPAVWLSGEPHQYAVLDPDGTVVVDSLRLATNTLLWADEGRVYRLEASISRQDAIDIAATVVPAAGLISK